MQKIFKLAKFVGSDYVIHLNGTKKEKAKFKSEAMYLGKILYIGEDFETVRSYYKVNGKILEVQRKGISHYQAERIMEDYPDCYVHGYIESGTIFHNEEVLVWVGLVDYGLYRVEEDTSEDCSPSLELCPHEVEEDTLEDTSEDCSDGSELCPHEEYTFEDCGDSSELCPHEEEDTSEDYIETTNVCEVEIKNHCLSFSETMLVHEAVEKELIGFLGDLSLERWELFDTDIDCTLCLDEQYNNMVTGFIMFGAVLRVFASDVKYSRDYYLGYMARSYNLRKWEIKELANLIDIGINLDSSVIEPLIEPHSFTLRNCLKSFINTVYDCICFETHRLLYIVQVVEKLQTEDWFDRAAKFYLTKVCWGKFKPASFIDDGCDIEQYDYPVAIRNYNVSLGLFEEDDMSAMVFIVAENLNLDGEFIEEHSDGTIGTDTAIHILNYWRNQQNKNFKVFPYNEQIKLKVLDHVIRKLKGVH